MTIVYFNCYKPFSWRTLNSIVSKSNYVINYHLREKCGLHIHFIKGKKLSSRLHFNCLGRGINNLLSYDFPLSSLFFAPPLYVLVLVNYFIWDSVYNTLMQNSSHMALVRCLQLAFSLRLIALDNEGQFDSF